MVSSVERAPVCRAGGRGLKPRPDQHSIRYSHFAVSTPLGTKRTVSEEGMPHGQLLNASLTRRFCPLGDEVHYNPFASINRPPATVSMNALLSSLRFSFHMQSFADVLFSLQPPQLCLLSLVYNQFAQVPISFFLVYFLMFAMYSSMKQCCQFHLVLQFSLSSVQGVRARADLVY